MCVCVVLLLLLCVCFFFFQAEDGIRDLVRSRGLGDVYKRQLIGRASQCFVGWEPALVGDEWFVGRAWEIWVKRHATLPLICLLYTSDAADERSSVDLGGRRIINKKKNKKLDVVDRNYHVHHEV